MRKKIIFGIIIIALLIVTGCIEENKPMMKNENASATRVVSDVINARSSDARTSGASINIYRQPICEDKMICYIAEDYYGIGLSCHRDADLIEKYCEIDST